MVHLIFSVYASSKVAVNRNGRLSDEEIMDGCDRNAMYAATTGDYGGGSG